MRASDMLRIYQDVVDVAEILESKEGVPFTKTLDYLTEALIQLISEEEVKKDEPVQS